MIEIKEVNENIYKTLLNKGFKPTYYTNLDWFTSRDCKSRLFYKYRVESNVLLHAIFNVLNIYNEYFFLIENEDMIMEIEVDENLEEYCLYFMNVDTDNYIIPTEKIIDLLNIIPNNFLLEYYD